MAKADDAARAMMEALTGSLQVLRNAGNVAVPSDELAGRAVRGCLNNRTGGWRASKPDDDTAGLLWQLVKFHRSGGSLYGWPWFADERLRDELDTLAQVLLGGRSNAANAWQRAIYG
jgi:hypothetical protein